MSHALEVPKPPSRVEAPRWVMMVALAAVLAGAGVFAWALLGGHPELAWSAYLIGAFYTLSLGLFGLLWNSINYLAKGVWSVTMRRIPEAMTSWLLPGGLLTIGVVLGGHHLYHWSDPAAVQADELLRHKEPFLNMNMFCGLVGASLLAWLVFAFLMRRNSRAQDESGKIGASRANVHLSALFVVIYAVSFSLVSFYLLMSLEAHWFSTMYAVLTFTDMIQTGTAFVSLVASILILRGGLGGFINENHLHSLAKMMFAFTGFWAYIYFCQYLLIWYGNLPEETIHFIARQEDGWLFYILVLPLLKFVIPFIYMVPRVNKRRPRRVAAMAVLILVAQFWELYVLVGPAIGHGAGEVHAHVPWAEFVVTAGFLGLFVLVFLRSLSRHDAVPLKDPRIRECLGFHQ